MDRNGILIKRCFDRYLVPMVLLSLGVSLSEFVDSIIVSNLLGEQGLVVVNAASPITLVFAFIALIFGIGGSVIYANRLGERKRDEADRIYSSTTLAVLGVSVVVAIAVFLLSGTLSNILVEDEALIQDMNSYIQACALFCIPYIFITCNSDFIISAGHPNISTFLVIEANVVNLIMDVVCIRVLEMGATGAAFGTLSGYASAVIFWFIFRKKTELKFTRKILSLREMFSLMATGAPQGIGQLGIAAKFSVMNQLALSYAGMDGQIISALCIQALSIISLVLGGVFNSFLPIISTLSGEEDMAGIRYSAKHAFIVMISAVAVLVIFFEAFPGVMGSIYNVTSPGAVIMVQEDFRIFSVVHIFRSVVLFLMYYYSSRGFKKLSLSISLLDSFLVIPISYAMCALMGVKGLWSAYTVSAIICLIWAVVLSQYMERKDKAGGGKGILLIPPVDADEKYMDITIRSSDDLAANMSESVEHFLLGCGIDRRRSIFSAVVAEEMAVFTGNQMEKDGYLDIRIKVKDHKIHMYFRSDGKPMSALNAYSESDGVEPDNLDMIYKIAESVEYSRLLGMNSTKIIL